MGSNKTPEEQAREKIDEQLRAVGWDVVPRDEYAPGEYCCLFPLTIDTPSSITKAAIEEGRRIAKDPNVKGYNDMSELRAALET